MGCFCSKKHKLTKENLEKAEERLLDHNGLGREEYLVKDVKVSEFQGEDVCIRTIVIDA